MSDDVVLVQCKLCEKPILQTSFSAHIDKCKHLHLQQYRTLGRGLSQDDEVVHSTSASPPPTDSIPFSSAAGVNEPSIATDADPLASMLPSAKSKDKKRKAINVEKGSGKRQIIDKNSPNLKNKKGPIDLDRQCGVVLAPSGLLCMRAITCKNHSVSTKRAVQGRSQEYDTLVLLYQFELARGKEEKKLAAKDPNYARHDKDVINLSDYKLPALDADSEAAAVLDSIKRFQPQPMALRAQRLMRGRSLFNVFEVIKRALTSN